VDNNIWISLAKANADSVPNYVNAPSMLKKLSILKKFNLNREKGMKHVSLL
jgi:hypothetical protein